jgi:hypothetical protein
LEVLGISRETQSDSDCIRQNAHPNKVPSLNDEIPFYAMKATVLVALWHSILDVLTGAEFAKVFGRFGANVCPKFHFYAANPGTANADICINTY